MTIIPLIVVFFIFLFANVDFPSANSFVDEFLILLLIIFFYLVAQEKCYSVVVNRRIHACQKRAAKNCKKSATDIPCTNQRQV